ncbi:MAG: serine/threonine-protein phosphatase [Betaproteobacteria bacterium]|nr:MAG: serine/threonine-protein phosphatase [Betaproteobacteria bacterium]
MQFSIYQESRRGSRKSNQDRIGYCYSREAALMLVADGMGGHLHGEVAAQIALEHLTEAFRREAVPRLRDPAAFLRQALIAAHHAIIQHARDRGLVEAPRTTCVACVVQDHGACWAHAGDSRLYHIRNGGVVAQTRDHSLVQQLIDSGRIRAESVAAHPDRNRIFSCLGSQQPPKLDLSPMTALDTGDTLLLCSDGLWNPLSPKIIGSAVQNSGIMLAVPELLDEAERRAGRASDNLSVIALTWEEQAERPAADTIAAPPKLADAGGTQSDYLSDEEIERAIARIRDAMKRHTNDKT